MQEVKEMQEVKVRLKINNTRYIGIIEYPFRYRRFSDFLNDGQDFLKILQPESIEAISKESVLLVNKKNIVYLHSVEEEYAPPSFPAKGAFFQVTLKLKRDETIKGLIYCSYEETDYSMEGILRQTGFFIKVKNPVIVDTSEKYHFLAVGKSNILTMEIDPKPYVSN
ncbi:MAG: hypothetical protein HY202_08400 [Nitrospirae bacterium]|nr:hypothetical protein [Nitrospirota bacterium]MBI3606027.1 hypothetical protein [Nitrospirota bacterium]